MTPAADIGPARTDELLPALQLIFQHVDGRDRAGRVAKAEALLARGELQRDGILVARSAQGLLGAMVALPLCGAGGLVRPPQLAAHAAASVADRLVQHAQLWLREHGAKLAQALLVADEVHLAAPLERNGFVYVTRLLYLRYLLATRSTKLHLRYQSYPQADSQLFRDVLLRTYEGTLDCPELRCVRSADEIIAGHMAQGAFRPERWWLAWHADEPVGVLLLSEMLDWQSWDVAYVGVVPQARGQGWGRELMVKALTEADAAQVPFVTLAVDARNWPARALYDRLGFEVFEHREVYLYFYP